MALTTMQWLETYSSAGAALSLIIEGYDEVFATDAMPNTYSVYDASPYSQWPTPQSGKLFVSGVLKQQIQLYAPDIEPESLSFKILDADGELASVLLREGNTSGLRTYLTSNVLAGSTADINVKSTTGFPASGTVYIGDEAIQYTGTTATSFTGVIRGRYAVNQTSTGTNFSPCHLIDQNVTATVSTAPSVTNYPRTWYGRFCHLLLHIKDPLTGQYNLASEATKLWSGRLESYADNGDGTVTLSAKSVHDLLFRHVGPEQWSARMGYPLLGTSDNDYLTVSSSQTAAYAAGGDLGWSGGLTHEDIAEAINAQLRAWNMAATTRAGDLWGLELIDPGNGNPPRYVMRLRANSTAITDGAKVRFGVNQHVLYVLGFTEQGYTLDNDVTYVTLERVSSSLYEAQARFSPIVYKSSVLFMGTAVYVDDMKGTFVTQTAGELNATPRCNGVVHFKFRDYDHFFAVKYEASGSGAILNIEAQLDQSTGKFRFTGDPNQHEFGIVRLGEATEPPIVRQAYYQRGQAGTLLLRALLSSGGASGYNHPTYDVLTTPGMAAAVPCSLVDVDSFEQLNEAEILFLAHDPKPFYEHLEPVLAVLGYYVVWKSTGSTTQPKLTAIRPSLETIQQAAWQLNESNKANGRDGADRVTISRGAEGVINRVVVKYGHGILNDEKSASTLTAEHYASQSDYGRRRTVTIKAPTVTNVPELIDSTIAPALAYFARPLAVAERSVNASFLRMAPGDTASLTDYYVMNPTSGVRGDGPIYCWVLGTEFDLGAGRGRAQVIFLPEKDFSRTGKWAPSARVDETAGGGGYNAGTLTLTLKANEFSGTGSSQDATFFEVGDAIKIYELDAAVPLSWTRTITNRTNSTITHNGAALAGFVAGRIYAVEYDDINAVTNSAQRNSAFIADDATFSTGYVSDPTPYEYGQEGRPSVIALPTLDYTQGMFRPDTAVTYATAGEPFSAHKVNYLVKAANNALGYRTRNILTGEAWPNEVPSTSATSASVDHIFCQWYPVYGHIANGLMRGFKVRLRGRSSNAAATATFVIVSSSEMPVGPWSSADPNAAYPRGSYTAIFSTTSATAVWSSEMSLACAGAVGLSFVGTWISVYAYSSNVLESANLSGLSIVEASL